MKHRGLDSGGFCETHRVESMKRIGSSPSNLWYVPDDLGRTVVAKSARLSRRRTNGQPQMAAGTKADRGFASMDRNKRRGIASKGGKAAHLKGTAHEWTIEEAREAGRQGGATAHRRPQMQRENGELPGKARPKSDDDLLKVITDSAEPHREDATMTSIVSRSGGWPWRTWRM
jgi:general stress protein YciG